MGFKSIAIIGILLAGQLAAACPGGSEVEIKANGIKIATFNKVTHYLNLESGVELIAARGNEDKLDNAEVNLTSNPIRLEVVAYDQNSQPRDGMSLMFKVKDSTYLSEISLAELNAPIPKNFGACGSTIEATHQQ